MTEQWSQDLQNQTLKALDELPVTADGLLHLKHCNDGYGHFDLSDLLAGRFVLHLKGRDQTLTFTDARAVVASGWVVD